MYLLDKDDLKKVVGGAGISLSWIAKIEKETGRSRVNTGLKYSVPKFQPPIVKQHYWR